jgi:hypothetical protein
MCIIICKLNPEPLPGFPKCLLFALCPKLWPFCTFPQIFSLPLFFTNNVAFVHGIFLSQPNSCFHQYMYTVQYSIQANYWIPGMARACYRVICLLSSLIDLEGIRKASRSTKVLDSLSIFLEL